MSAQYLDNNTDLIWQPDVRVSAFESGLILVQQSAVCRRNQNKRSELEVGNLMPAQNTGAIDGVYIFPAPQERRDAVYTTYDVSGYGRTTANFRTVFSEELLGSVSYTLDGVTYTRSFTITTAKQSGVIEAAQAFIPQSPLAQLAVWRWVTVDSSGTITGTASGFIGWAQSGITRTNYGSWDEIVITWDATYPAQLPA